jgi:hypothetical protein
MENPFYKRATEYLRDNDEFLSVVTPEPILYFLKDHAQSGRLYDRLVRVWGTPGSGKTTIGRLFEFSALSALARASGLPTYKDLAAAMVECCVLDDQVPTLLGCRLPLETSFRDFWELPYAETTRFRLLTAFLQAKAALAWLRQLGEAGVPITAIRVVPRTGCEPRLGSIGGEDGASIQARARTIEASVYKVVGSVIAPEEGRLPREVTEEFPLFDLIDSIEAPLGPGPASSRQVLRPLVILDDAHVLHPEQYGRLKHWLARRELRLSRWLLARFDVLQPDEAIEASADELGDEGHRPGLTVDRDIIEIRLQRHESDEGKRVQRKGSFRAMAKDMANRLLSRMPMFSSRKMTNLADLLSQEHEPIPATRLARLRKAIDSLQGELRISPERRASLEAEVERYAEGKPHLTEDVCVAMLAILLHRYSKRTGGPDLFGEDPEPSRPVVANTEVEDTARLHLFHEHDRPYYRGIDDLCDASTENAEQFLYLAAVLVDDLTNQLSRSRKRLLTATRQNQLLREQGVRIIADWNFPYHVQVRQVVETLGERCRATTLEPNGWLRPNAYGIPNDEFQTIPKKRPELARILQFGAAYNAWSLRPNYGQGYSKWCLIELGGAVILKYGLSLRRGGFLEGTLTELGRLTTHEPLTALGPRG